MDLTFNFKLIYVYNYNVLILFTYFSNVLKYIQYCNIKINYVNILKMFIKKKQKQAFKAKNTKLN